MVKVFIVALRSHDSPQCTLYHSKLLDIGAFFHNGNLQLYINVRAAQLLYTLGPNAIII